MFHEEILFLSFISDFDAGEHKEEGDTAGRPAWMVHVQHITETWLKLLPKVNTSFSKKNFLFHFVFRRHYQQ